MEHGTAFGRPGFHHHERSGQLHQASPTSWAPNQCNSNEQFPGVRQVGEAVSPWIRDHAAKCCAGGGENAAAAASSLKSQAQELRRWWPCLLLAHDQPHRPRCRCRQRSSHQCPGTGAAPVAHRQATARKPAPRQQQSLKPAPARSGQRTNSAARPGGQCRG